MIDSHCHLTYISKQARELEKVLERANKSGVLYFVDIGVHPKDIDERIRLLSDAEGVFFTAGYYPDYASEYDDDDIKAFQLKIETINKKEKTICAVGEIGLDYHHNSLNKEDQKEFFRRLINVAKNLNLPISIHTRDAFRDTFRILGEEELPKRGILHCFSGNIKEARKAIDLGYILSFSGAATYIKNDFIRDAAKYVPNDMFTLETDSPYLTPQRLRGRANEPAFIPYIAEVISEARGEKKSTIMRLALENAVRVLDLDMV